MQMNSSKTSRRGLLFGTAAAGAVAATVATLPRISQPVQAVVEPKPLPEKGGGYSVSEHVKHYYRTTLV
jgi:cobalamin biosynthesis protein CbiD